MNIKLHLDEAEYAPIQRAAEAFGCKVEDLAYAAVNLYMLRLGNFEQECGPECRKMFTNLDTMKETLLNTKEARKNNLPLWADSGGSVHSYEGMPPDLPSKSKKAIF